ncbi:helix-turn-helix domain-containing protein [uncultured Nostoc sp.]|uniref:helix-turn-helix domain-containing protein n=1 Tax=uncultured Nostoc sp. TaxID=340711 RepID=UPI0035CB1BA6
MEKQIMFCKLRSYMEERGLNIAQLSREVGVTENAIRGYAKNSFNRIDCQVAMKLCSYFGVNVGDMFEIRSVANNQY